MYLPVNPPFLLGHGRLEDGLCHNLAALAYADRYAPVQGIQLLEELRQRGDQPSGRISDPPWDAGVGSSGGWVPWLCLSGRIAIDSGKIMVNDDLPSGYV